MEQAKGILWIDVTMLINHQGQLTGIQRVEYNLASRYAELPNVKFCVFQKQNQSLVEFDFKHLRYKIDQLQLVRTADNTSVLKTRLPRRIAGRVKRLLQAQFASKNSLANIVNLANQDALIILSGDWSDGSFAALVEKTRSNVNCKIIQIVYDMLPAFYPSFFVKGMPDQFNSYMARIFANIDGILAISESTKQDIQKFCKNNNIKQPKIKVFRLGDDFAYFKQVKPDLPIKANDYLLCVCTIESRKNHMELFYAAKEAVARGQDFPQFVLVGKRGWLADDFLYLIDNDPVLSKKFLITSCTDQELAWLYANCRFTVFPSFYEGWGLPVAESLFYKKLCLSSNTSSMPEIAGQLIDYFSPNDPVGLLDKITQYWTDQKLLRSKEAAIKANYKATSWDESFNQVQEFVNTVR